MNKQNEVHLTIIENILMQRFFSRSTEPSKIIRSKEIEKQNKKEVLAVSAADKLFADKLLNHKKLKAKLCTNVF